MYVIPIVFLIIVLVFIIILHFKKQSIIRKIRCMPPEEKCNMLNALTQPLGYCYEPEQDIFSTIHNPWQRSFGYRHAYDISAPYFSMVYDYQTVYFDYNEKTWLIEFWKGQYGINTGCEIGIYHTDNTISPDKYSSAIFNAASDDEMLQLSSTLRYKDKCLGQLNKRHWWLTIFNMGMYAKPKNLSMEITIRFPDCQMFCAFCSALTKAVPGIKINLKHYTVSFIFEKCNNKYSLWKHIVRTWAMMWCRIYRRIFCFITRPFKKSGDKVLYLYYYMPFASRKALRLHRRSGKAR